MSNSGSTLAAYRLDVFDSGATTEEKLESLKEYVLTLHEFRREDYQEMAKLRGRVRELEGIVAKKDTGE